MINAVSTVSHTPAVAPVAASNTKAAQPKQTKSAGEDTVQLSSAAQAALKEASESPAQTAKEATSGDHQAQRLLAREKAAEGK